MTWQEGMTRFRESAAEDLHRKILSHIPDVQELNITMHDDDHGCHTTIRATGMRTVAHTFSPSDSFGKNKTVQMALEESRRSGHELQDLLSAAGYVI